MVNDPKGCSGTDHPEPSRGFLPFPWSAVLFWIAFAVAIVALRGVRWDEHYELAEVVLGNVAYPEAHPLYNWTRFVRNLQIFVSSAIVWAFPGPLVICAFRNVLWLITLTIPLFLIARTLSGHRAAGHFAVVFAYFGIHLAFDSHYQMFSWPGYYSNGHVGRGIALFILWALLERRYRLAAGLLAFMPAIHVTQMVPVTLCAVAHGAIVWRDKESRASLMRAIPWALPGVALSAYLWLGQRGLSVPLPDEGPYFSTADNAAILREFLKTDPHRAMPGSIIPITNVNLVLAAAWMLTAAAARSWRSVWYTLWIYLSVVAAIVWGTMGLHLLLGHEIPAVLLVWMPYRFTNHAAVLLLAVSPAVLMHRKAWPAAALIPLAAVAFETLKPLLAYAAGAELYARYLGEGTLTLLGLAGAAAVVVSAGETSRVMTLWRLGCGLGLVLAAFFHQFGAACIAAGGLAAYATGHFGQSAKEGQQFGHTAAIVLVLAISLITIQQFRERVHLPRSEFDREVRSFLDETGEAGTMVAARPDQRTLQARIEYPVFMDEALATGIPYTPYLAATIQKMSEDLYGIRYDPPISSDEPGWTETWMSRTPEDWRRAAAPYGIRYVIAPDTVPLRLPVEIDGERSTLYRIP